MNKVKVGFFSFTEITDPGEHHAYNEWHQLDHMPEQFPLDGVAYGERWVSTPACRAARVASETPLDAIHYMTLYLMTEPIDRSLREFADLGAHLHALGRFHRAREAHFSGPLSLLENVVAPRALISPESVPYRPNRGVYVIFEDTRDRSRVDAYARWLHADHHQSLLSVDGVVGLWTFATNPRFRDRHNLGDRRITVLWLDGDPLRVAPAIDAADAPRRAYDDVSHVAFAGPFESITPWQWNWFDQG
jgi:hypothetical protein